jgi:repressor of nif and glnA expression
MSEEEKQNVRYFLQWIEEGGLSEWIEYALDEGDEQKLQQLKEQYDRIKEIFGF